MNHAGIDRTQRTGRGKRIALIVAGVLVVVLAAAYAAGYATFSTHFYPGTSIMGVDVSMATAEEAAEALEGVTDGYTLTMSGEDFEWAIGAEEAGLAVDAEQAAAEALGQNGALAWPVRLAQALAGATTSTYDLDGTTECPVTYDEEALLASLDAAIEEYNSTRSGTFDATSAYDEEEGLFTLEAALANRQMDQAAVKELALAALDTLSSSVALDDDVLSALAQGASDEELQAACDAANAIVGVSFDLTLGGTVVSTFSGSSLRKSISFDEDLSVSYGTKKLTKLASELAEEYDTVGTTRTFTGSAGDTVKIGGGTYGWEIDTDSLVTALKEAIDAGESGEVAIPTVSEAAVVAEAGEADWGAYAEVDISEQHAWYYDADGNLLWESGVITGNPNKGNDTPTGVYKVNAKYTDITLRGGYDSDTGEYGWETPVSYWMAFVGSSVGFHDATWQASSSFSNSSAYLSVGSHGCVNLPYSAAEELYDIIQVGDCVIVHE